MEPIYLGDGAYAIFENGGVWLRASHHERQYCSGEVWLENTAIELLLHYYEKEVKA